MRSFNYTGWLPYGLIGNVGTPYLYSTAFNLLNDSVREEMLFGPGVSPGFQQLPSSVMGCVVRYDCAVS